ncbi:ATP-dependent DNA ligase [Cohnella cellulosilytica]|uniref:ATP-dependent DNA ligase n=1 Tax=Cohnella cellulosilytica TaxID=986710 RepID=A0ABW2FDK2_9BACL
MFIPPMLPVEHPHPFDDERYIFEPLIDGHRLILAMEKGVVRLFTRHGRDITDQYPELHPVPVLDNSDIVLDGEACCIDPVTGKIDRDAALDRCKLTKPLSIREASVRNPAHYIVFDILRYRGRDVRSLALSERKKLLGEVLEANRSISPAVGVEYSGVALFEALRSNGLGGVVAKRKTSEYVGGAKDPSWLIVPDYDYTVVQIAGYRKHRFGWLVKHRDRIAGVLEHGIPSAHQNAFLGVSRKLATHEDRDFVYVDPAIHARVRHRKWTRDGLLRKPEFVDFVV